MHSGTGPVATEPVGVAQQPLLGLELDSHDGQHYTLHGRRVPSESGVLLAYGENWGFVSDEDYDFSLEDDERTLVMTPKVGVGHFSYDLTQVSAVRLVKD